MKSKEEIEQLIYGCFGKKEWDNVSNNAKLSLIETYTQCQEDMADEITQLKKSIQKAVDLMCEADEEIANLKEQLARLPKP
jgi:archaellum component FlaC